MPPMNPETYDPVREEKLDRAAAIEASRGHLRDLISVYGTRMVGVRRDDGQGSYGAARFMRAVVHSPQSCALAGIAQ